MTSQVRPHNLELLASGQDLDPHRRHQGHTTATPHSGKAAELQEGASALSKHQRGPRPLATGSPLPYLHPTSFLLSASAWVERHCGSQPAQPKTVLPRNLCQGSFSLT